MLELDFADPDQYDGNWTCHLQEFKEGRYLTDEASFKVQVKIRINRLDLGQFHLTQLSLLRPFP